MRNLFNLFCNLNRFVVIDIMNRSWFFWKSKIKIACSPILILEFIYFLHSLTSSFKFLEKKREERWSSLILGLGSLNCNFCDNVRKCPSSAYNSVRTTCATTSPHRQLKTQCAKEWEWAKGIECTWQSHMSYLFGEI